MTTYLGAILQETLELIMFLVIMTAVIRLGLVLVSSRRKDWSEEDD